MQLSQRPAWGYCSGGRNTWLCTALRCNAKREKQRHTMKMKCKTAVHITIIKKKRSTQERWNVRQQHVLIIKKKERHVKEGEMWDRGWKGGDKSTKWDSRASMGSWMERDGNEETKRSVPSLHQCFHTLLATFRHFLVLFCLSASRQARSQKTQILL